MSSLECLGPLHNLFIQMISLLFIALLTLASGFFSGSEVALFSLSHQKIKRFGYSHEPAKKKIAHLLSSPKDLLVTVFMLNTLVNILLQNVASSAFGESEGWLFKVGVPLVLTLICGEVLPKYFSLRYNEPIAIKVAPLIDLFHRLVTPFRRLTAAITESISQRFFFWLTPELPMQQQEIEHALKEAQSQKVIKPEAMQFAMGFLQLLEKDLGDCMLPKEDLPIVELYDDPKQIIKEVIEKRFNEVLICQGGLDKPLGFISAQQLFVLQDTLKSADRLKRYLEPPMYVPEQGAARLLLQRFYKEERRHAIVVDEYGNLVGYITLEELAAEVIGKISGVLDKKVSYSYAGKEQLIVSGRMDIEEINQLFGAELESEYVVTIGGWICEQLGTIPKVGVKLESKGLLFHVLAATPKRVQKLFIRQLKTGCKKQQRGGS